MAISSPSLSMRSALGSASYRKFLLQILFAYPAAGCVSNQIGNITEMVQSIQQRQWAVSSGQSAEKIDTYTADRLLPTADYFFVRFAAGFTVFLIMSFSMSSFFI